MSDENEPSLPELAERFFQERKLRADFATFDDIMARLGGEPQREGDEMPSR
jgi:hypothetical protein